MVAAASGAVCIVVSILLLAQFSSYRNTIIQQQQTQLLSISKFISSIIQVELDRHQEQLRNLADTREFNLAAYAANSAEIEGIYLCNSEGKLLEHGGSSALTPQLKNMQTDVEYGQYSILWMTQQTSDGDFLCVAINLNIFYDNYILDQKLETKGYVSIKDSDGYILMYPEKAELGLHTLEDRKQSHPEFDLSELEAVIERQLAEEEGVAEYASYWWEGDTNTTKTRKISAFTPLYIGDDFWVVSVVVDYEELAGAIFNSLSYMIYLLIVLMFGISCSLFFVVRAKRLRAEYARETQYLKELNSTYEELVKNREQINHYQRLQTIGSLTSGIAHEFNNFLTPIVGYSALIMEDSVEDSQTFQDAEAIYTASLMAQELTSQISVLSRKNGSSKHMEKIEIRAFLTQIKRMVQVMTPQNITFKMQEYSPPGCIYASETQINQVIMNLTANAIHAMEKGGTLEIYAEQIEEEDCVLSLKLTVSDTGVGMDQATKQQLFDPFFTTKGSGKGLGLGLAVVQQIVQEHKGRLSVESEQGHGSCFSVFLPWFPETVPDRPQSTEGPKFKNMSVLVVDDDIKVLNFLKRGLTKHGYRVEIQQNAMDALEVIKTAPHYYDCVVTDNMMPELSGVEFAKEVKFIRPDLQIFLITALMTAEVYDSIEQKIIRSALTKPLKIPELIKAIQEK